MGARTPSPRSWRRRLTPRSARLRLTLVYSGLFLTLGTVIVVLIFVIGSGHVAMSSSSQAVEPAPGQLGSAPALHAAASQQHTDDVNNLLAAAWVTLVLTAVASAVLGWFVAGRVLRPLRQMTSATRAISAGSLHQRLALAGPDDEFKELGDTIDALLGRLEASFAAQRRFVANAAHELRTPLTVERTLLQVALANPEADATSLRATCEELIASGRDQERLIDSLLTLATSERGLERRETLDLAEVTEAALHSAAPGIERSSLSVTTDMGPVLLNGDRTLIESLVGNLIDNAVDYNLPQGRIHVEAVTRGDRAVLTVTNSGPEIPAEAVERLFEPFRRLHTDRTGSDGHIGLGLSIVRAVAQAHDATVTATPEPRGGLKLSVDFPASYSPSSSSRSAAV